MIENNTNIVYTLFVLKNITLSAEEALLQKARARAAAEHKSLNAVFRDWIAQYARQKGKLHSYSTLMKRLAHVRAGGRFSREESNVRG